MENILILYSYIIIFHRIFLYYILSLLSYDSLIIQTNKNVEKEIYNGHLALPYLKILDIFRYQKILKKF